MRLLDRMFPRVHAQGSSNGGPAAPPRTVARATLSPASPPLPPGGGAPVVPIDLMKRREELADELAGLQLDLGGLTYEMAVRDHFRLDVLVKVAARLQRVDAELGEVERLLRLERAGAAGHCPACDALHGRGAVYCWQCGRELLPGARPELKTSTASLQSQSE